MCQTCPTRWQQRKTTGPIQRSSSKLRRNTITDQLPDDKADDLNPDKVQQLVLDAVGGLDPRDLAERIAWCRKHNAHGTTVHPDGDVLEFRWGDRTLALVHRDMLTGDGPLEVDRQFIAE
jgi:hypothetical protein